MTHCFLRSSLEFCTKSTCKDFPLKFSAFIDNYLDNKLVTFHIFVLASFKAMNFYTVDGKGEQQKFTRSSLKAL